MSDHVHHGIDYIEFSVTDMAKGQDFYAEAFGWEFTDYGPEYAGIKKPTGGEWGGFAVSDKVVTGGPLVVLYSESLEKTLEAVKGAGGVIMKPIFEFPGGKRFEFIDPFGNELAVWTTL